MGSGNVKKFEVKLAKTGIIILVAGMTVLVCLSFILGISVGKDMDAFPGKIASFPRRIAESVWRPAKVPVQHTAESPQDKPEKVTIDLSFHKDLTSEKLPSMQPAPPAQTRPAPEPQPQPTPQSEDSIIEELLKKQETLSGEAFSVEKPPPEKKDKAVQDARPAGAGYIVHVTSLKDRDKASATNKTIASMGYTSKVTKVEIKGKGTWYRVIVTGFESRTKAQKAAEKIGKKVNATCAVWPVQGNADKKP
jgi:cell division protein FtsN